MHLGRRSANLNTSRPAYPPTHAGAHAHTHTHTHAHTHMHTHTHTHTDTDRGRDSPLIAVYTVCVQANLASSVGLIRVTHWL